MSLLILAYMVTAPGAAYAIDCPGYISNMQGCGGVGSNVWIAGQQLEACLATLPGSMVFQGATLMFCVQGGPNNNYCTFELNPKYKYSPAGSPMFPVGDISVYTGGVCQAKSLGQEPTESCGIYQGNPINTVTGNKFQLETDYIGSGVFPLKFTRSYNNLLTIFDSVSNWNHGPHLQILSSSSIAVIRTSQRIYNFTLFDSVNNIWGAAKDVPGKLAQIATGWNYTNLDDEVETYDTNGKLQSITNRAGLKQTLIYSDGTNGSSSGNGGYVLDATGNSTTTVLPSGLLIRVTDASRCV